MEERCLERKAWQHLISEHRIDWVSFIVQIVNAAVARMEVRLWRALLTAVRPCACPAMSRSSRAVLVVTALFSAATVAAVHVQQRRERERLHSGVLRDLERQNQKRENIRLLEEQIALTKQLTEEREKMLMEKGSQHS